MCILRVGLVICQLYIYTLVYKHSLLHPQQEITRFPTQNQHLCLHSKHNSAQPGTDKKWLHTAMHALYKRQGFPTDSPLIVCFYLMPHMMPLER